MSNDPMDWSSEDWFTYLEAKTEKKYTTLEKAGEGNMNLTLRAANNAYSLIIKHAPPYCAKFPSIPAPIERLRTEYLFYRAIEKNQKISSMIPGLHHFDHSNNVLLMEDLGKCQDYSFLYNRDAQLDKNTLERLGYFLTELHSLNDFENPRALANELMKTLNHQYIFELPYTDHSFDVSSLFPTQAQSVKTLINDVFVSRIAEEFGEIYKTQGQQLLHGDYYPASWLANQDKLYIIDPEFCLVGKIEFDLSVALAHMALTNQTSTTMNYFFTQYRHSYKTEEVQIFASLEVIRRLTYVSQLPIKASEQEKIDLLDKAVEVIKGNDSWN